MLVLKHKFYISLFLIGAMVVIGQLLFLNTASAQTVTCPDGFSTQAPLSEREAICAGHQTDGPENDFAGCYVNGVKTTCPNGIPNFDPSKCYTASGSSSGSSAYKEVACSSSLASASSSSGSTAPPVDCATLPEDPGDWTAEQKQTCIAQPHGTACTGQENTACGLFTYINTAIKLLSALIGIVVTGMIIVGGIKYSMAGSDPGAVEKAKKLIFSAILTLVGYGLLFAIAQWLLPGGIL